MENILKEKSAVAHFNIELKTEYSCLKPKQVDCLRLILESDTLAILPTGYGKSLIFELIPFYAKYVKKLKSLVIIIAPLNGIIQQELRKLGQSAAQVIQNEPLKTGVLYYIGHPEDVLCHAYELGQMVKHVNQAFIVVDEAHCVLDWGEDFRPDFRAISHLRAHLPSSVKMLAVTATASKVSQKEIAHLLGMRHYVSLNTTPVMNQNVYLSVFPRVSSTGGNHTVQEAYNFVFKPLLLQLFSEGNDFPLTIVYCKLQWCGYGVELAQRLLGALFKTADLPSVVQYHAQQPAQMNTTIINSLSDESSPIKLVFATVALGMGCDLRHVRRIVHAGTPSCLEVYTQEVGRAGRDGRTAEALLFCNATDLVQRHIDPAMKDYCNQKSTCRRKVISDYFNSSISIPNRICCDVCRPSDMLEDSTMTTPHDLKLPSLVQRQQMREILDAYSGECPGQLSFHLINLIMDTFEYPRDVNHIMKSYKQPETVAQTILSIKCHVMS